MSQFPGAHHDPFGHAEPVVPRKTSGLAVTALVCSLILCCPVTTVLGVILGAIGMVTLGPSSPRKGRGLSLAAMLLGVVFTLGQAAVGYWIYDTFIKIVLEGPREALAAGFGGNVGGFKASFHGAGATASDAEANEFIESLRTRYGNFISINYDDQGKQPSGGRPEEPFPYRIIFDKKVVDATAVVVFADQATGAFVGKFKSITVHDPQLGDLAYPSSAGAGMSGPAPASATAPATDGSTDATAPQDSATGDGG